MTPTIAIAVFVLAAALILWNVGVMRRFKSEYRFEGQFQGQRYECVLRFANFDHDICASLGADSSALYLLIASKRKRSWFSYRRNAYEIFKTDLRIPWTDLAWQEKRILLKDCIWFEISAKKIYFFIASDIGNKLLIDAQQRILAQL